MWGRGRKSICTYCKRFFISGYDVEILLGRKKGDFFDLLNPKIQISVIIGWTFFDLNYKLPIFFWKIFYTHIFTASDYISAVTIIANYLTKAHFQTIVTLHYDLSFQLSIIPFENRKWLIWLNRTFLTKATKIVAVSDGVNDGLRKVTKNYRTLSYHNLQPCNRSTGVETCGRTYWK